MKKKTNKDKKNYIISKKPTVPNSYEMILKNVYNFTKKNNTNKNKQRKFSFVVPATIEF